MTAEGRADPLWSRSSTHRSHPCFPRRKDLGNGRVWADGDHTSLWGPICRSTAPTHPRMSSMLLCLATSCHMLPFALKFKLSKIK